MKLGNIPDGKHQLWSIPRDEFSDSFPFVFLYKEEGFATTCKNKDYMTIHNGNQEIQVYVGRYHPSYLVDVLWFLFMNLFFKTTFFPWWIGQPRSFLSANRKYDFGTILLAVNEYVSKHYARK